MNALILAAGRGTRIAEVTDGLPKSFLELGGKKIIEHQIDCVERADTDEVVVLATAAAFERPQKLIARATGNARMLAGSQLMGYFHKIGVEAAGDPAEANAILGAPTTTLDQWLDIQAAERTKAA